MNEITPLQIEEGKRELLERAFRKTESQTKHEFYDSIFEFGKKHVETEDYVPVKRARIRRTQMEISERNLAFLTDIAIRTGLSRSEVERIIIDKYLYHVGVMEECALP